MSDNEKPASADFFQFSMNMDPRMFEILCSDYLHNEKEDSGFFKSSDLEARLTTENLDIQYRKSSDERTVSFSGCYSIPALPEQFSTVFASIVNIKAAARQMKAGGLDWVRAVDTALNMTSFRRGGWHV